MNIDRKTYGTVTVIAFAGEFDALDMPSVREAMEGTVDDGCQSLVFNFRELTFIDSTWIGYVLHTARELKARGGELVLSEPSPFFTRVGSVLGVDKILPMFPDDQAALDHFGEGGPAT